ncbi:MAG TPA: tetratricopeptide repeat protein, partial [Aggregatilineaceae bacterium]|nr:tetratricopeptide repeat protein [Aggregatilineaceae bacterium]
MLSTPNGEDDGVLDDSGIIARPRLLSKLQGAETHKLTLISAPPGYGKTTLASQFVRQTRYPVLWYSVEERDRDVPTLYTRCLTLLERVTPGTAQLPLPYGFTANDLATAVGNFLHQNLNVPILFVLDDVHHLTGSSDAEAWLRVFVLAAPPNCHFILMSRTLPDLPLVEMIARREVLAIGQEELRLTPYEIEALARRLPTSQTPGAIDELTERLEGWPAGTVLALYPLPPEFERAILQGRQGPEALFDSLAAVMLDSQPERMRSFLLASSTLRRMTPELCEQALTLPDAATLIREAQARNLFLSRTTGGLVYHALFRRFLQHYLETTDPRRYADFHAHAARWFEQHNVPDDAFNHYYSARFYTEAAHVADQMAQAYFVQGKVETLLTWESMLRETDAPSGRLLYSCALIHTDRYEFDRAEEALERIPLVAKDSGAEGAAAVGEVDIRLQRAMIQFRRGNYEVAAAQAGALLKELPDTIEANNARRRALDTLGTAQLNLGEVESARRCLEEAVPLYRTNADAHALSQVLQNLGVVYLRLGRLTDASATLQEVVAIRRALGGTSSLALALNNLAYYYHQCNDYRQALITLKEGLSIVSRFPSKRTESYLLWSLGDVQRDRGLAPTALEHYQKALDLVGQHEPPLRCGVLTSRAMLYRWQGDLGEALRGANEASELALLHDLPIEHNVAQAVVHIVRVENGESEQGLYNLEQIARNLETAEAHFELVRILAFSARAAQPFNPDLAKNYLRRAFQQGEKVGSTRELIIELANSPSLEA